MEIDYLVETEYRGEKIKDAAEPSSRLQHRTKVYADSELGLPFPIFVTLSSTISLFLCFLSCKME